MNKGQLHFLLYGFLTLLAVVLVVTLIIPKDEIAPPGNDETSILDTPDTQVLQQGAILPIPLSAEQNSSSGKTQLGEKLFHDPHLSADGTISCASCHILANGGDDGRKVSRGVGNAAGTANAPTVFNTVFGFRQFWDGRAANLSEQIAGPLLDPSEMASNWATIIRRIKENAAYSADFRREYNGEISERTITDALVHFELSLLTPNAPFDRFLNGDKAAIDDETLEGFRRFTDYGCISCHQGIGIGGNFFQRFGIIGDYFADRGNITQADLGRYNVTKREEDRYVFKVPGLRNVAVTAPYFHDGSINTLGEAINIMGRYQLGRALSDEDRRYITAFLNSLTGEYRGEPLQP
ncbi:MAG: cytochrome-c peroxidase [Azoarcus sp.]|jgi:cytochrome c peroxidase|nr:cytochrome-c peroxidase [Azoarcus sp.]